MDRREIIREALINGHTLAAADQILINPEPGTFVQKVQEQTGLIRTCGASLERISETLIELALDCGGIKPRLLGYGVPEVEEASKLALNTLHVWDHGGGAFIGEIVNRMLGEMKSINGGNSLTAYWAGKIQIDPKVPSFSFVSQLTELFKQCVYWEMTLEGYGKFGNDFARGLKWLPWMKQVSTNPALALLAYKEDESLKEQLREKIALNKDWLECPEKYAREIAMKATWLAIQPNIAVFRPMALNTELEDYQVSLQLDPTIANLAQASIEDAMKVYDLAKGFVKYYDYLLGLGERAGEIGPNIVFKVAASHKAALEITRTLNSQGIGTNNTLVYTVSQAVYLFLEALAGKAAAIKNGLPVVRTYMTNMGGRLSGHLRKIFAVKLFRELWRKRGVETALRLMDELAKLLGVDEALWGKMDKVDLDTKSQILCSFLKTLENPIIIDVADRVGYSGAEMIKQAEQAIQMAGTMVARRVWWIFFSPGNLPRWITYLKIKYDLSQEEAEWVLKSMDELPASKRTPQDTLLVLGQNVTHTEFPNQQLAVELFAQSEGFDLNSFRSSIQGEEPDSVWHTLGHFFDFIKAYEITPSLSEFLSSRVGVSTLTLGRRGLAPNAWPNFGPVQATANEFSGAFKEFLKMCVGLAQEAANS